MVKVDKYFANLQKQVKENYKVAGLARAKGLDPASSVEVPLATSLAEKAVGLVSTIVPQLDGKPIVKRILELEKEFSPLDPAVALTIAEEIAKEKFCKFSSLKEGIEAGARVAIAYLTLGVVSSPIEGFIYLEFFKTREGKEYFAPFYAGPIRSAGGTEAAFSVVILDHLREVFGFAKYDPTEAEVKRAVHESYMYHERVTNLQYLPSEEEIEFLASHLPVQVSGDPSEKIEVFNYKDLPRVPTNCIRSGFALVLNEGLAQKAPKILKRIKHLRKQGFKLSDWDFLEEFVELQGKIKAKSKSGSAKGAVYIKDIVAGRPVFAHPSRSGGFRLRYGRCRNTGYSCLAVHPATMKVCNDFIAIGTQLKIEKPTKGCTVASCTTIDAPIVKLTDGSVVKVSSFEQAAELEKEVAEIIYLGDLLVPYGDFANRNHALCPPAYVEQYWLVELKKKLSEIGERELLREVEERQEGFLHPSLERAKEISAKYGVALHPDFVFYWREINAEELFALVDWLANVERHGEKFVLPYSRLERERFARAKRALELIGCPHKVFLDGVILEREVGEALLLNLGIEVGCTGKDFEESFTELSKRLKELKLELCKAVSEEEREELSALEFVKRLARYEVRDKSGTFIGARMGRPEKAKLRKLTGSPHVLFPVGEQGGRLRSVQSAVEVGKVRAEFVNFYCNKCHRESVYPRCEVCGGTCEKMLSCPICKTKSSGKCEKHNLGVPYAEYDVDIRKYFDSARKLLGLNSDEVPLVKGIRGTSNKEHYCEHLAKGLLRARQNLNVNKDGTIRYDISEMPITHFKPKEIGTSVERLRELGYELDVNGKKLVSEEQVVEIFPHDIILPASPASRDERADEVFLRIAAFVDDELEKLYSLPRFFNAKRREDLIGHLTACIAPHNCAAVVGRIIGFSKVQALLASPYMHAAMRRDCDGDEAAVMLLMDMLLNFSRAYLPAHRGGTQDAPLVLNSHIRAGEVDDMIFDLDVSREIPLELYEAASEGKSPFDVKMESVKSRLGKGSEAEFARLWFSYDTDDINLGAQCSSYKTLATMQDKVEAQMKLCERIRAVDTSDVARLVIERHFLRDIRGNLRKFSMQAFRCVNCNEKYRRPPLSGKCTRCGGKIIFTISEGSIMKYVFSAMELARKYNVSEYLRESLELTEMYIESIFGREKEKQTALDQWF
ncbi:DNA polymerase II large subunit [Candidatus Pacearchaeota archaeon]|nr:MAG: DNA polymerase II large subunit [Candidatus Pacearchaeota archaeon]